MFDPGETLASSAPFVGDSDRFHGVILPDDRSHYVRVLTSGGDSGYDLVLSFSNQQPTTGRRLTQIPCLTRLRLPRQEKSARVAVCISASIAHV